VSRWAGIAALALTLGLPSRDARAATWTSALPPAAFADDEGLIRLPAGVAMRIEPGRRDPLPVVLEIPSQRDVDSGELVRVEGEPQPLEPRGQGRGLILPAAPQARLLQLDAQGGHPRVRLTTRKEQLSAWLDVIERLDRAREQGPRSLSELSLPWGSTATLARLRLRARAVADRAVRALGTAHDLSPLVPLHRTTHALRSERITTVPADQTWDIAVQGPGTAIVRMRPRTEQSWIRTSARLQLDDRELPTVELAGTGTVYAARRIFVPPGVHRIAVTPPLADTDLRIQVAQLRSPAFGPRLPPEGHTPRDPVSRAELLALGGDRVDALRAWQALLDVEGVTGELARVRLVELTDDPDALAGLATLPPTLSPDGREAVTDAILDRALDLPPDLVEAAVLAAARPDPAKVASWLDALEGRRPRGAALLRAARPLSDDGRDLFSAELAHRTLHTRFHDLRPVAEAAEGEGGRPGGRDRDTEGSEGEVVVRSRGPGIPRLAVAEGEAVDLRMPEWDGRLPVLRLRVPEAARFILDGKLWSSGPAELRLGLDPGLHHLRVIEDALLVLDPEIANGGHTVFETTLYPLPARFRVPDVGARVDLRITVDPPRPVRIQLDDGEIRQLEPDGDGVVELTAGAWARSVAIEAAPEEVESAQPEPAPLQEEREQEASGAARVAVEMRTRLAGRPGPPPAPVADVEQAIAELADLSRAIDAGFPSARLARAALLGRMGLLSAARRDLLVLIEQAEDHELREDARALAGNLAPSTPSAPAPGPVTAATALAAHDDPRPVPAGPPELRAADLEEAAAELDEDALWLAAAEARWEAGDGARAWADAVLAHLAGSDLRASLLANTRWTGLRYADGGAGMVRVPLPPTDDSDEPTWRRARTAMLAAPWDAVDAGVLRIDGSEQLQLPPGDASVELFCRDERGPGTSCRVPLRLGATWSLVEIDDGDVETLHLPLTTTAELEVKAPGRGHALALRAFVDDAPVQASGERTAQRVRPGQPLTTVVGGPLLLRMQILRGEARLTVVPMVDGRPGDPAAAAPFETDFASVGAEAIVAAAGAGPHQVIVTGDGDVRLFAGTVTQSVDDDAGALPPELLSPEQTSLPVDVDTIFEHLGAPAEPDLRTPGRGGSYELLLSGKDELIYTPTTEHWLQGEFEGRWMSSPSRWWSQVAGWGRAPRLAAGAAAQTGPSWSRGFAGLRVDGAAGRDAAGNTATELGASLRARHDFSLGRQLDLRLDGRLRAALLSEPGGAGVDGRAWSLWRYQHPVHLVGIASFVGSPSRDLRWRLGLRATTNTGPSLDRAGPEAAVDLLLPTLTVVGASGRLEWQFADEYRATASLAARLDLKAEHGIWEHERRWWRAWGALSWRLGSNELVGGIGLRCLFSPKAGLRDLPPGSVAFRSLRELP